MIFQEIITQEKSGSKEIETKETGKMTETGVTKRAGNSEETGETKILRKMKEAGE